MRPEARTSLAASLPALRMTLLFAGVLTAAARPLAGAVLWTFAAATVVASILAARAIDRRRPPLVEMDQPCGSAEPLSTLRMLEPLPVRARRTAAPHAFGTPRRC
jgi:hypothetical protein